VIGWRVSGPDLRIEAGDYRTNPLMTLGHEVVGIAGGVDEGVTDQLLGHPPVCESACGSGLADRCDDRRAARHHVSGVKRTDGGSLPETACASVWSPVRPHRLTTSSDPALGTGHRR
jgi:threonine dehydrogenase-like Zn-dependent dehydrogenase